MYYMYAFRTLWGVTEGESGQTHCTVCVVIVVFLLYIVFSPANVTAGWTDQCFLNDFICSTLSW